MNAATRPGTGGAAVAVTLFILTTLMLAWFVGGQAALGRIDAALAIPWLMPPLTALAVVLRQWDRARRVRWLTAAAVLLTGVQAGFMAALAGAVPSAQVAAVVMAALLAALFIEGLIGLTRRLPRGAGLVLSLLVVAGWFAGAQLALARAYDLSPAGAPPPLMVISGLPLRWAGSGDLAAALRRGPQPAPALAWLEARFAVRVADSPIDPPPPAGTALLLAHPRALSPQELVAIDTYVRGGGRAVILADALSNWPVERPLGDPHNPPVTSLLTPLLDHWGIELGAAPPGETAPTPVMVGRQKLRLFSAGRFTKLPPGCIGAAHRRVAICRIGHGEVRIVGDADLLFAPLWQDRVGHAPQYRRADTMEWIAGALAPPGAMKPGWLRPVWHSAAH